MGGEKVRPDPASERACRREHAVPDPCYKQVSDDADPAPVVTLVSITSSEADAGLEKEDKAGDIDGALAGTDDRAFLLRAERSDRGTGRIYAVTYRATDAAGNTREVTAQVVVPHDRGR